VSDALRTAVLRKAALTAWTQHAVRFREDANSEEDHARGYYRDRVVVELAQNAADAAARAGVDGRLLLRLVELDGRSVLVAANSGAALDADGVASLASLRASAKRDTAVVGRFGVGFAAVRSVSDTISLASGTGVHFSLEATRAALTDVGNADLAEEVSRRGVSLPVLRLPFPGVADEHEALADLPGWDTVVVLTLRDAAAVAEVRAQLAVVDDVLLLALPALSEVTVEAGETRTVRDVGDRWVVAARAGILDPALLADRPVEERDRTGWQVTWAVRRGAKTPASTVHAPTPTDEPCTVPALLIGTFPLDPTRRHVAPGAVADALVAEAGRAWADLLAQDGLPALTDLLPGGMPAGALDAALREAVLAATRRAPVLEPAAGGRRVAPADAVVLSSPADPVATRLLGRSWPALVDLPPNARRLVRLLAVPTTDLAELVGGLPSLTPTAARELYEVFAAADPATLEQLGTVPVPLVDGRTVHGARGLLLLDEDPGAEVLATLADWGLRVVHPGAAHPLLERLGAERTGIVGLLRSTLVRDRVLDDPESVDVVPALLAAALRSGPVEPEAWWGEVPLAAADGELVPARGLVLAGSDARSLLDPDVLPTVDPAVQARWGAEVLVALGVRSGPAVLRVPLDLSDQDELAESLDGWAAYRAEVVEDRADDVGGVAPDDVAVVADLDAVLRDAWPEVLRLLVARHRAVLEPVRLGPQHEVPSYTTWWVRTRAGLGLERPFALGPGAPAWLPEVPASVRGLDEATLRRLGGALTAEDLAPRDWANLLADLDEGDPVQLALAVALWRSIAERAPDRLDGLVDVPVLPALAVPSPLTGVPGSALRGAVALAADDVAVASPMWAQRTDCWPVLIVPVDSVGAVADGMDLDRADERAAGTVTSAGERVPTPDAVRRVFPAVPAGWVGHDDLRVDGVPVDWWLDRDVHASTTSGLARGLAALLGSRNVDRIARLLGGGDADEVLLDLAGD
jgi:hypothetical protein